MLVELYWFPVKERIANKICMFVFKYLNHSAPQYLQDIVIPYKKERSLRSENKNLTEMYPARQKRTGERSFAFNAGKYWNLMPKELRLTRKVNRFKFNQIYRSFIRKCCKIQTLSLSDGPENGAHLVIS